MLRNWRKRRSFSTAGPSRGRRIWSRSIRAVLERYRRPGKLYPKEYSFRLLGDLRDKTILDVGCGEGEDGMILAKLGARVTGLDVSPAAIELARQRAAVNGVSERTRFVCAPLDAADLPERSFDVIWIGRADRLQRAGEPEQDAAEDPLPGPGPHRGHAGRAAAGEVRSRSAGDADPRLGETALLFPGPPDPIRDSRWRYERAPAWRRLLADLISCFDRVVLSLPVLEELGGIGILSGRKPD